MITTLFTFNSKDWLFFFNEQIHQFSLLPFVWDPLRGNGFGENISAILWIRTYLNSSVWILYNIFKFNWFFIEIVIFWLIFIILGIISINYFVKTVFIKKNLTVYVITYLIYFANTYILMLLNGGQLGVFLAYAVTPLVFSLFIKITMTNSKVTRLAYWKKVVLTSLALSLQILFDPRITYITLVAVLIYYVFNFLLKRENIRSIRINLSLFKTNLSAFLLTGLLTMGVHFYWLSYFLFSPKNLFMDPDGTKTDVSLVKFLSFGDFSHSLSLLHPTWPENIFGKTYFLQPEFLLLPIIAYSSLLFLRNSKSEMRNSILISFFALLSLIGIFLAKGSKEPFGEVYLWLFNHVPGFIMFRDSTKWYILISLSYSVLIPFTILNIYQSIKQRFSIKSKIFNFQNLFLLSFILYLIFLIRPLLLGQVRGTFKVYRVPEEYVKLKDYLYKDKTFSRTLWIPKRQRFGFYDFMHPAVSSLDLFKVASSSSVLDVLNDENTYSEIEKLIKELGIKYVIVPYDSQEEFFLEDRKYSPEIRQDIDEKLEKITFLKKKSEFKDLSVYELKPEVNSLFTIKSENKIILPKWKIINPAKYNVSLENVSKNYDIIFSQTYDSNWTASINGKTFTSKYKDKYHNVFELSEENSNFVIIEYKLQKYMYYSLIISILTLLTISFIIVRSIIVKI